MLIFAFYVLGWESVTVFWAVVFYAWEHLLGLGYSEDFYFGILSVLSVFY